MYKAIWGDFVKVVIICSRANQGRLYVPNT